MVEKVITNLDLSKASGPNCIAVVVLEKCELELSDILTELFNKYLKESCFPDCWKISSVVPVFKGSLSGLRQFLATESPLKVMKNAFYFISKSLFVLKIFKFLS